MRVRGVVGKPWDDEDETFLVACAWCNRYRVGGRWTRLAAVPADGSPITHGICPACFVSVGGNASR